MKIDRIFDTNSNITLDNLINSLVDAELDNFFNSNDNNFYTMLTKVKNSPKKEEI